MLSCVAECRSEKPSRSRSGHPHPPRYQICSCICTVLKLETPAAPGSFKPRKFLSSFRYLCYAYFKSFCPRGSAKLIGLVNTHSSQGRHLYIAPPTVRRIHIQFTDTHRCGGDFHCSPDDFPCFRRTLSHTADSVEYSARLNPAASTMRTFSDSPSSIRTSTRRSYCLHGQNHHDHCHITNTFVQRGRRKMEGFIAKGGP